MPRPPKPWYWRKRKEWFVTINRIRHRLGPDKPAAVQKFHELMTKPDKPVSRDTVVGLMDTFLEFAQTHNAKGTYDYYRTYCQSFANTISKKLTVGQLRPFHVQTWVDSHKEWSDSTKRAAIVSVKRSMRWATQMGYIDASPIAHMGKPEVGKRERMVSEEEYKKILATVPDREFKDLVELAWDTGARPQELFAVEARHVDLENARIVFPPKEAKGKRKIRSVYLSDHAVEIVKSLILKYPEGRLLRNTRGIPWTASATNCRFRQLKKKLGVKYNMYMFRHTTTTAALASGLSTEIVRELMGHVDGRMLAKHYSHIGQDSDLMRRSAAKVRQDVSVLPPESSAAPE